MEKRVNFCHMAITLSGSEREDEEFRQWKRLFKGIEDISHKADISSPIIESAPLAENDWMTVLITGKDLFIGIYNEEQNTIRSSCVFNEVKMLTSKFIERLIDDVSEIASNKLKNNHKNINSLWGKQLVRSLSQEYSINEKVKYSQAIKCLEKVNSTPLDVRERKVNVNAYLQR